jgi:colicin import membrane protein
MSTVIESQASPPPPPKEDPWRLGWRYVPHVGPDRETTYEQVPLTEEGLLFPEEGDFVVTNESHHIDCFYLKAALKLWAARREGALALGDHRVDWGVSGLRPLGPDVVVFDGLHEAWDPHRGTFPVKTFGARTLLVIEVTSPDSRPNDLGIKVEFYHRVGALFYAIVDRHETRGQEDGRLLGYRADPAIPDHFVEVGPDERGRLWLESVRLWLTIENDRAVLYEENGDRIPSYAEAIRDKQSAEARIAAAEARTKELEAELQRLRGNLNGSPRDNGGS